MNITKRFKPCIPVPIVPLVYQLKPLVYIALGQLVQMGQRKMKVYILICR